jgi:hypothetical protein
MLVNEVEMNSTNGGEKTARKKGELRMKIAALCGRRLLRVALRNPDDAAEAAGMTGIGG